MRILLVIFFVLVSTSGFSQKTSVKGNSPAYIGKKLIFREFAERLLHSNSPVFEINPDENGFFHSDFEISETTFLFTESGAYRYYFYAEPGKKYTLVLPPTVSKTPEQEANPYYIYNYLPLELIYDANETNDCKELNEAIKKFDEDHSALFRDLIIQYYSGARRKAIIDSFRIAMQTQDPACHNEFYVQYIKLKCGALEFTDNQFNLNELINDHFGGKPVLLSNPAWWELFEKVYEKYFSFLSQKDQFKNLYRYLAAGEYTPLKEFLRTDPGLMNDTLTDLVLIREINNEFYEGSFSKNVLISLLDSISEKSRAPVCRKLASQVKEKNTRLQPGSKAPEFNFTDETGEIKPSSELTGKYIYLGFCTPNSLASMKEMEYLKYFQQNYSKDLTILTIFDDMSPDELKTLSTENNYNWVLASNKFKGDIFNLYDVNGTPVFFLISPGGKLLLSPAPSPSGGFENTFFSILRDAWNKKSN